MAVSVKLDPSLQDRLQRLAGQRDRTAHYLMREAIQQYLDREEARESFKQEALASWAEYQETGLHVTDENMRRWLRSWGTEDELPPPEPHT
jgi:predicted transcriptional regulator